MGVADLHIPALQAGGLRRCRGATGIAILTDRCTGQLNQGERHPYCECKSEKSIFVTRKGRRKA